jgi:hypothetical protein
MSLEIFAPGSAWEGSRVQRARQGSTVRVGWDRKARRYIITTVTVRFTMENHDMCFSGRTPRQRLLGNPLTPRNLRGKLMRVVSWSISSILS